MTKSHKTNNVNDNANGGKDVNVVQSVSATANKSVTKAFTLTDVAAATVQRARQIRKTDFVRFQKFYNFFSANDEATARAINIKADAKREQVDKWMRGVVEPKTFACIQEIQETPSAQLALLIVSAALSKYGEQELDRRDNLGEMDYVVGARFGTNGLRSKRHVPHMVGVSFILRLVLGLAPEKRVTCQILREILSHESNARLVLTPTSTGLQLAFGIAAADSDDWAKFHQDQLRQMARQAQSDKFQETMQQLGGEHLYDAIRTQLKQAGGASVWDATNDKPALQAKNIRPRSGSADKSVKPQKEVERLKQQAVKKNGTPQEGVKKHLPVEAEKWSQVPPPAPIVVKSTTTAPSKKEAVPNNKTQQVKDTASVKNVSPVKDASTVKNVSATVAKNQPGAIVSSARGGRAVVSKAL